jgi:hypothetical protein
VTADIGKAEEDLRFVRRAVRRDAEGGFPGSIALLWAAISAVGFPLMDLAPRAVPWFWAIASPLGLALSVWLGGRAARAAGEVDRGESGRWAAHWLGLLGAIALAVLGVFAGKISWDAFGAVVLLLVAVAYFAAAVHLHRSLGLVAAILAAGYVAVLYLPWRTWTLVGLASAGALVAVALLGRRKPSGE